MYVVLASVCVIKICTDTCRECIIKICTDTCRECIIKICTDTCRECVRTGFRNDSIYTIHVFIHARILTTTKNGRNLKQ